MKLVTVCSRTVIDFDFIKVKINVEIKKKKNMFF